MDKINNEYIAVPVSLYNSMLNKISYLESRVTNDVLELHDKNKVLTEINLDLQRKLQSAEDRIEKFESYSITIKQPKGELSTDVSC